ncbi:MAG: hypothetical protein AAF230_05070 [Pseudomonadota bacterium]
MLKPLICAAFVMLAAPAQAETLRQFHATTSTPLSTIATALEQRLPDNMLAGLGSDTVSLAYSGNRVPPALTGFLQASFKDLPPESVTNGETLSLSLTLQSDTAGTLMSLMMMGDFPTSPIALPKGSKIMVDGSGSNDCAGQVVLSHPKPAGETAADYVRALKADGFTFPDVGPAEVSFFIGYAPNCQIAMYLHPEQDTTLVVIRYLED